MKNRQSDFVVRSGFTLIEMLVVVLIILMLSGMLFKIAGMVSSKAARAKAVTDIANIEFALAEYYSEYDIYPPTSKNRYVYENSGSQPDGLRALLAANNDPEGGSFITDSDGRYDEVTDRQWGQSTVGSIGYEYGLVSYLWSRNQGGQVHWYDGDTERDISAKLKWQHFLKNVNLDKYGKKMQRKIFGSEFTYTNSVKVVNDPWGNGYKYECSPPYLKYKIWSGGPTGGSEDDINNNSFNE